MPSHFSDTDLLDGIGPHLVSAEERAWAADLVDLLDEARRALRNPRHWGAELSAGQISDADLAKLPTIATSAHTRMRFLARLPLPAPIRRLSLADLTGGGLDAFCATLHVPRADRWSTSESADRPKDFIPILAACRCAVRLGLWPDDPGPEIEDRETPGPEWIATVSVMRTVHGTPQRRAEHSGRSRRAAPTDALRRALAIPTIERLAGNPDLVHLDALQRCHRRDAATVEGALAEIRSAVRATS